MTSHKTFGDLTYLDVNESIGEVGVGGQATYSPARGLDISTLRVSGTLPDEEEYQAARRARVAAGERVRPSTHRLVLLESSEEWMAPIRAEVIERLVSYLEVAIGDSWVIEGTTEEMPVIEDESDDDEPTRYHSISILDEDEQSQVAVRITEAIKGGEGFSFTGTDGRRVQIEITFLADIDPAGSGE